VKADEEAVRLNTNKEDGRYDSYLCSHCEHIHIGRTPKTIKFSHIASNRETAALALELGPRAIYCMLAENMVMDESDKMNMLKERWRRAAPSEEADYPEKNLP
jgi:hypothetical protein